MEHELAEKIAKEVGIERDTIRQYASFFEKSVRPLLKKNYLSHLVATIQDMVNDKRIGPLLDEIKNEAVEKGKIDSDRLRGLLATKTLRLYSIILEPAIIKKRATTRHHPSGAIIYYNSGFDEKTVRILIAHEIGHIVNKELLAAKEDSERTANLFAYIAIGDKNEFYKKESEQFTYKSDIQLLNEILKNCPV